MKNKSVIRKAALALWDWLKKRLGVKPVHKQAARNGDWPTREEMVEMPPFEGFRLDQIVVVETEAGARRAMQELMEAKVVGFDTESKPTFVKGHISTGPHVVQFATLDRAYIFPLHHKATNETVCEMIAAPDLRKVGFGLSDDLRRIESKLKVKPQSVLDLETVFAARGWGRGVGVRVAVALVFKRRFLKSRRASTSNWAAKELNEKQLLYAANDVYAPIRVFYELGKSTARTR